MEQVVIDKKLLNKITLYLMERPFKEVAQLIAEIGAVVKQNETKAEP